MEDDAGLREGIRKIPRRRKAPSKIQVEDDGENSPVLKNSAEAELGRSDDIESGEGGLLGRERRKDKDGVGSELDSVDGTRESLIKREEAKRDDIAKKEDPKVETIRVDPVKEFFARQRRLDKMSSTDLPEMHVVGQIKSCTGLLLQDREGACCRWKVEHDKAWQHLGGELSGQTQIAYCKYVCSELVQLNHPIDLHFAEAGLHVPLHDHTSNTTSTILIVHAIVCRDGELHAYHSKHSAWMCMDGECLQVMDSHTFLSDRVCITSR